MFVAITPCRLVDTRPGESNVGSRATPLGPNDTLTLQVTGSTVQCSGVPADAVAAALNVTAIRPTASSFLSVYPAGAERPNASNLNWAAGDPPTPNKVDVELGSTGDHHGRIELTNSTGEVHVAADLVGYDLDHTHDDRYHTRAEVDAMRHSSRTVLGAGATVIGDGAIVLSGGCAVVESADDELLLPLDLPSDGAVTAVSVRVLDGSGPVLYTRSLQRWSPSIPGMQAATLRTTTAGAASGPQPVDLTPAGIVTVGDGSDLVLVMSSEAPARRSCRAGLGYPD